MDMLTHPYEAIRIYVAMKVVDAELHDDIDEIEELFKELEPKKEQEQNGIH